MFVLHQMKGIEWEMEGTRAVGPYALCDGEKDLRAERHLEAVRM